MVALTWLLRFQVSAGKHLVAILMAVVAVMAVAAVVVVVCRSH